LLEDPELDATNIEVGVKDGEITLSGTVGSRYLNDVPKRPALAA